MSLLAVTKILVSERSIVPVLAYHFVSVANYLIYLFFATLKLAICKHTPTDVKSKASTISIEEDIKQELSEDCLTLILLNDCIDFKCVYSWF